MALSKVKSSKQRARLAARVREWDSMRTDGGDAKHKVINKQSYTKPGSNKK